MPLVAPRVGAWIETTIIYNKTNQMQMSHPVWVRGLKHGSTQAVKIRSRVSHPVWVRGLKQSNKAIRG